MLTREFDYLLPEALIAQHPLKKRALSRLLCLQEDSGYLDKHFFELPDLIEPGDLLVFNDTQVIPARLFGRKSTGGKVEIMLERIEGDDQALCHIRASKSPQAETEIILDGGVMAQVLGRVGDLFRVKFELQQSLQNFLVAQGHMPLPPYINRPDEILDKQRYQTVYAKQLGAVAAPTAGLHFDQDLLEKIKGRGVKLAFITLHVGAGTFQPVRTESINDHTMHAEWINIPAQVCADIIETQRLGGKVIAVGTTVMRCLESVSQTGLPESYQGETSIFITPGYEFKCVDALITNFHLPCSTLLMLVCAFAGYENIMRAYQYAIEQKYRFYSYGDAMFVQRNT